MACPPISDPEAEASACEEILSVQLEIGRLFSTGAPTKRFDEMVESAKDALRRAAYTDAMAAAFEASIELEAFKRDLASSSALLSEVRTAISKATGLGLDTTEAAAHLEAATRLLNQGAFKGIKDLVGSDLRSLQETLWTSDAARDAILQAQQVLLRLFQAGTNTAAAEKGLGRAREAMRDKRFAKALVLAHKANPDKVSLELERQEVAALIKRFEGLRAEAHAKGLVVEDSTTTLKRARNALDEDLSATAAHVARAGIEDLERLVRSHDHAAGLKQKAEGLYAEIAAEAGRDPPTERGIQRANEFLAAGRFEEAQLLASRLVERMAKQRMLVTEFNSRRSIANRYLRSLLGLGLQPTEQLESELLRSLTLQQSWFFQGGLDSLERALTMLLDLLATDANMDRLEARIEALLKEVSNASIRMDLAKRVWAAKMLRRGSMARDAYRALEEVQHIAESSLAGQAATPSMGEGPITASVGPVHELSAPLDLQPPPGGLRGLQEGTAGLPGDSCEVEVDSGVEPPILSQIRALSNDRTLLGLDTRELDGIVGDVRRLWDADDTSSAEVLVEFARRTAAPNPLPYTHGIEVEMGLVYGDGSWVTGARVSKVVEDVVAEGIERLRGLVDQGRVPSYVAERFVDLRIAEPEKPKRGKVVQLDYLLDGRMTSTEVIGRDAHGVGTTYIIELVTPPCRYVEELLWWLACLHRICCDVLESKHPEVRLISIGLNPAQPYSEGISFGDHHHIGFPDEAAKRAAYNMLRAHVPHMIAMSANSPIYKGIIPSFRCDGDHPIQFVSRTDPLSIRLRQNIGQLGPVGSTYIPYLRQGDGSAEFTAAVRKASAADARLVDIYPFTRFGTIEVRFFDAQLSILDRVALAIILQAICRWGERWAQGHAAGPEVGHHVLLENRDRAIQMGMLLGFQRDRDLHDRSPEFALLYQGESDGPDQKVKRIHDAVARMFENIWEDLESIAPGGALGGMLDTYLVMVRGGSKRLLPPPITPGQFLLFTQASSSKGVPGLIEYLDLQGRECARNLRHNPVTDVLGAPVAPSARVTDRGGAVGGAPAQSPPKEEAAAGAGTLGGMASAVETADGAGGPAVKASGGEGAAPQGMGDEGRAIAARAGQGRLSVMTTTPSGVPVDAKPRRKAVATTGHGEGEQEVAALTCHSCSMDLEWGSLSCPGCGKSVSYRCPVCSASIAPEYRFCPTCGSEFSRSTTSTVGEG